MPCTVCGHDSTGTIGTIKHAQLAAIAHNREVIARYRAKAKTPGAVELFPVVVTPHSNPSLGLCSLLSGFIRIVPRSQRT